MISQNRSLSNILSGLTVQKKRYKQAITHSIYKDQFNSSKLCRKERKYTPNLNFPNFATCYWQSVAKLYKYTTTNKNMESEQVDIYVARKVLTEKELIPIQDYSDLLQKYNEKIQFTDDMLKLYVLLDSGKLGRLLQGDAYVKWYRPQSYYDQGDWRGTWALDGGGAFMNQGIHFVDLLLSVMGPVKNVVARTRTAAHAIEVEDQGAALLEFESGALGVIQASTAFYPGLPARLEIHGTQGAAIFEGTELSFLQVEGETPFRKERVSAGGAAKPMAIPVLPFIRQFSDFIAAVRDKRPPTVSGQEARRALALVLAIYNSSQTGKAISLEK
jgi:hypothetical protein